MDAERLELVERFLDDSISAPGMERLLEALRADESFRAEFAGALRLRGLLEAGFGPDASCERLAEIVARAVPAAGRPLDARVLEKIEERGLRPVRRRWWSGGWVRVVAAGWIVAIGAWILLHEPPAPRFIAVGGKVFVERGGVRLDAAPGFALRVGDAVGVPTDGWAVVRYPDGTTLRLVGGTAVAVETKGGAPDQKRLRVASGTVSAEVAPQPAGFPMVLASPHAETKVLGTSLNVSVAAEATRVVVRRGRVEVSRDDASLEVSGGQAATAARGRPLVAEPFRDEVLRRLGRDHFMLGVMAGWGETWTVETRAQGCAWDLRYQHLGGDWTRWNPDASFPTMYLEESDRLGILPVFTLYGMVRSEPGKSEKGGLAAEMARNAADAAAMRKYFAELKILLQRAGKHGKPAILHVEPGLWDQFLTAPEFRPNALEKVRVVVKSAGLPEFEGLDDTAASFGKAFGLLRDCHAPNVLLAGHFARGVGPDAAAGALASGGGWDLLFTEVGDRDAGFKAARGAADAWWKESDFRALRDWGAAVHARTGLPLLVWRIPLGNTRMAACNNTPWHYMDDKAEHWLEDYPSNPAVAEWARAGFVGLLFGGGTVECTVHKDSAKDGVTNPPPVEGNRGERSAFPDDDGGYLRLRAGNYYRSGALRIAGER